MHRGEEEAGIAREGRLGPVAVMDIEIRHGDPRQTRLLRRARRQGDIGIDAKAHGEVRARMVAWRAYGAEGALYLAARHRPRGGDDAPRRPARGGQAAG